MKLSKILKLTGDFIKQYWINHESFTSCLEIGSNFSPRYANNLGLEWEYVYELLVNELKIKKIRLPIYWDEIEKNPGCFDWSILNKILAKADANGLSILLTIGHRSPRWPECYCPSWTESLSDEDFFQFLLKYINSVVSYAKSFSCIEAWQIENEPFATKWGNGCRNVISFLQKEINIVKEQDPTRPVVLTYPNLPWLLSDHYEIIELADIAGIDIYDTVWFKHRLYTGYIDLLNMGIVSPLSLSYQRYLTEKCKKDLWIAELQAEPWGSEDIASKLTIDESLKSMSPSKLIKNVNYAHSSGIQRAYLWGIEWWIFERDLHGNSSMWEVGKDIILKVNSDKCQSLNLALI